MKKAILLGCLLGLAFLPFAALARGDEEDWNWAQEQNQARAFDQYLLNHPQGVHAAEAIKAAAARSVEEIKAAAESCNPLFPRLVYYTLATGEEPLLAPETLEAVMVAAAKCKFSGSLDMAAKARAMEGMWLARKKVVARLERFPLRAVLEMDFILLEIEEALIDDLYKKILKCSDQSAWTDTDPKKVFECSKPYLDVQTKVAEAMADQASFGFAHVAEVKDNAYRLKFWERYQKMAKREVWVELSSAFNLGDEVKKARAAENDAAAVKKIDDVELRLAAGGKPVGGSAGF